MPIDLYYSVNSAPSRAILATVQYLDIGDVNIKQIDLGAKQTRTPEFLKINPNHTIPAIVDNGFTLFESRAILQYLINQYRPESSLYPRDVNSRALVDQILYFDASSYVPSLRKFVKTKSPELLEEVQEKISILETILGDREFITGDTLTIADISLAISFPLLKVLNLLTPKLDSWNERIRKEIPQLAELNDQADMSKFVNKK